MTKMSVSMKMTPKQAGALYMRSMKLKEDGEQLESENKQLQARVAELEEQKERIGKAVKKAFPCLDADVAKVLFVHMDDYNNIAEQLNDTSQQSKERG